MAAENFKVKKGLEVGTGITATSSGIDVTGIVTATTFKGAFSGDGSAITGVTASGSGVIVRHDGSNVGTAGTIDFSTNLDVSAVSAGIVTITATGSTGISTVSGVVSIANDLDVDGHTELDGVNVTGIVTATELDINGSAEISGDLTLSKNNPTISLSDTNDNPDYQIGNINGLLRFQDTTNNVTRLGINTIGNVGINSSEPTAVLDVGGNAIISGVVTATTFKGALEATSASFSSDIDANANLDVDGETNLDDVVVAGVSTFK